MREIGGYFELEHLISNEYHKNLLTLNSGRNSLIYILKSKKIEKIYIPYYLCDSIYNSLKIIIIMSFIKEGRFYSRI